MFESKIGELAALGTALCWTICSLAFEAAGRKVGSLTVNIVRLVFGFSFLCLFSYFSRGLFFPFDASQETWLWLLFSGFIGFFLGDMFLFKAFTVIGARISMLIMASVPPLTAICGYLILGETLTFTSFLAMIITIIGITLVILKKSENRVTLSIPLSGLLFAVGGAAGQALGLVISKLGMGEYNAFAATQIRIIAALFSFSLLLFYVRGWGRVFSLLHHRKAAGQIATGAIFGPFLGVSLSLISVQYTSTGVSSTLMALVPVLIIFPSVIFFKEKVTIWEVFGSIIAVTGAVLLFL